MSSNIKVSVFGQQGEPVYGATVMLLPVEKEELKLSDIQLEYRELDSKRYVAEHVENGNYILRIEAAGHQPQEKKFSIGYPQKIREFIFLGAPGSSLLRINNTYLPYTEVPDKIYISTTTEGETDKIRHYLNDFSQISIVPGLFSEETTTVISFDSGMEITKRYEFIDGLKNSFVTHVIGLLLKKTSNDYSILSAIIRVKFNTGSVNLYVNELTRKYDLVFKSIDQEGYYVFEKLHWLKYEVSDILADIGEMDEVAEVIPEYLSFFKTNANELPPIDFLYPQQWYLPVVRVPDAWQLLRTQVLNGNITLGSANDITYGSSEIIVGIIDNGGIKSSATLPAIPTHPDLNVNISSGNSKAVAFLNIPTGVTNHNTIGPNIHGISCLGVAVAAANNGQGIAGVASNSRFIAAAFNNLALTSTQINNSYRWSCGLQNFNLTSPAAPISGSDILTVSQQVIGAGTIYEPGIIDSSVYGRNGRGAVIFNSASNDNKELTLAQNALAFSNRCIAVTSSTLDSTGLKERKAVYSNFGQRIDVCAPADTLDLEQPPGSGLFSTVHNPPSDYGALTLYRDDITPTLTTMPGTSGTSTTLDGNAGPANTNGLTNNQIKVVSAAGFAVNQAVLIGAPTDFQAGIPSATTAEARRITAVSGTTITLDRDLDRLH
ncbi:MAG: S8 family serine peptidase, partial [Bacteroidia bacterium]